jgi:hypothetical protein
MCSHGIEEFFKIRFLAGFWMKITGCFLQGRFIFTLIRIIRLRCTFRNRTILGFKGEVGPDLGQKAEKPEKFPWVASN